MREPILSRDQILNIVRKTLKENNDRDKLSSASFVKLVAALEEAWLEKVCVEPVALILRDMGTGQFTGTTLTRSASVAERHGGKPLFALTRSKPRRTKSRNLLTSARKWPAK
ncbi:hypothetical protein [Burkholderia contaminans]|uniref:hypothetical protein n=1 Tax=Burkholderia contaminans TaxID=488447 RepID=UPI0014537F32|nr:hypothetical protein [Burkholderia contaminans]VWD20217.1 hypothetical protein BCO18442_03860 [Burkholderia contaminans]